MSLVTLFVCPPKAFHVHFCLFRGLLWLPMCFYQAHKCHLTTQLKRWRSSLPNFSSFKESRLGLSLPSPSIFYPRHITSHHIAPHPRHRSQSLPLLSPFAHEQLDLPSSTSLPSCSKIGIQVRIPKSWEFLFSTTQHITYLPCAFRHGSWSCCRVVAISFTNINILCHINPNYTHTTYPCSCFACHLCTCPVVIRKKAPPRQGAPATGANADIEKKCMFKFIYDTLQNSVEQLADCFNWSFFSSVRFSHSRCWIQLKEGWRQHGQTGRWHGEPFP